MRRTRSEVKRTHARRNSVEAAAEMSEVFHGRPAHRVTEYIEELHVHRNLAEFGRLLMLKLQDGTKLKNFSGTVVGSNEAGSQLYFQGGDQSVDLSQFDVDATKASVRLGLVKQIEYFTSKEHLGEEDKTPGPYIHTFGEEGGQLPELCYDTDNQLLALVGGTYHVDKDMHGKYSAGIRD